METIRAFIAVDIGDEIREHLIRIQQKLKRAQADVRWVKPGHIHLTLAFLGEIPVEKLAPLQDALDSSVKELETFQLQAAGTGFFGRSGRPRVIWAGIAECRSLELLRQQTVAALHDSAIPFDSKPFSPHLTLGRVKAFNRTAALLDELKAVQEISLGRTVIDRVELIQSRLTPDGADYTVLHIVPLLKREHS